MCGVFSRVAVCRFATSSDQLEDKAAFEKEARSVISLLQLPLTGIFNRLTMSVCRATIDTQVRCIAPDHSFNARM